MTGLQETVREPESSLAHGITPAQFRCRAQHFRHTYSQRAPGSCSTTWCHTKGRPGPGPPPTAPATPLPHPPAAMKMGASPPPTTASIEKGKRGLLSYIPRLKPPFLAPIPDWGLPQRAQSCPTLLLPMHSQGKASSWALPHHSSAAHTHLVPQRMRKQLWEP